MLKNQRNHGEFKYFVKIEKSYGNNGDIYVEGIASGLMEDNDSQRMSLDVIKAFADSIPLPLTNGHPKNGPVGGELGQVISATILNDDNKSLFIKARLDSDNPYTPYLAKKIQEGKKFGFSIEGYLPEGGEQTVWSEKLNEFVKEYTKLIPKSISVTSEPSYIPSLMSVVTKASLDKEKTIPVNNLQNTTMTEDKVTTPETNIQEVETESTVDKSFEKAYAEKFDNVEKSSKTKLPNDGSALKEEDAESQKKPTKKVKKADMDEDSDDNEDADDEKPESDSDEVEKAKSMLKKMGYNISKGIKKSTEKLEVIEKSQQNSFDNVMKILKSMHEDLEALKTVSLGKKSKIMTVEKSAKDRLQEREYLDSEDGFTAKWLELNSK